jgi:hypothetical protein
MDPNHTTYGSAAYLICGVCSKEHSTITDWRFN